MGGGRGRSGKARTQRKHFRQSRENVWKRPRPDPSSETNDSGNGGENPTWTPFATQNSAFDDYYKEQGIVPSDEWDAFVEVLRTPLPAAFRINSSSQFCTDILFQLENDFMQTLQAEVTEGGEMEAIRPLPWYPENLAWHSNFSRMQLRKNQTLERFHEFLKLENEIGNITRQEAVSMVPPLFLDVQPNHVVLDMCAAPGSKTFQLLELMHRTVKPGLLPEGLVVANDLDVQRCNLLIHQTKRMCTANLIVTNHEAQHFPGCRLIRNHANSKPDQSISQLLFDRVLCDVPCSGDGTLRKAPDLWRKWNTGMGNGLHSLQVQIAMRGASLLKVGGRMVYSTCSMNPVENEAVVAEILRKCEGSLELLDVSSELPQLVCRPGLKKWKVRDRGVWLMSCRDVPVVRRTAVLPSMFPSGRSYANLDDRNNDKGEGCEISNGDSANSLNDMQAVETPLVVADGVNEECSDFPLDRCMRIVPHYQNSGAFFIAVFQKVSSLPAVQGKPQTLCGDNEQQNLQIQGIENTSDLDICSADGTDENFQEVASDAYPNGNEPDIDKGTSAVNACISQEEQDSETQVPSKVETEEKKTTGKRKLQIQGKWRGVDPVLFFKDEVIINSIKTFYGIDEAFPVNGHLISRNNDNNHVKRIYHVSKSVKDVLELNFSVGQQLKIASIGLKMFERQSSREGTSAPCAFRISSEGLPLILPYITKQILCASPIDFQHLLQYKSIKFADFVDTNFGEKAANLMPGCCVIVLGKDSKSSLDRIQVDKSTIAIGCWKGRASLTVMVTAIDCQEMLERLSVRGGTEKNQAVREDQPSSVVADEDKQLKDKTDDGMKNTGD